MKILLLIVTFLYLSSSFARTQKLLIQSASTNYDSYLAFVNTETEYLRPTEQYLQLNPNKKHKTSLVTSFEKAQKSYFNDAPSESKNLFLKVTGYKHLADWNLNHRKIILHSFLRAYELETDKDKKKQILESAVNFSMGLEANSQVFSPQTIAEYSSAQKDQFKSQWLPNSSFKYVNTFLVNGEKVTYIPGIAINLPSGKHRITALSDSHKATTKVSDLNTLKTWNPKFIQLIHGDCGMPQAHPSIEKQSFSIFYGQDCVADWSQQTEIKRQVTSLNSFIPAPATTIPEEVNFPEVPKTPILKNKWTWVGIGAAVVITGLIISQQKDDNSPSTAASTKQGF